MVLFWNLGPYPKLPIPSDPRFLSTSFLEEHPVLFPQLLETAPQSNENPSVDLLPPKSGESQL